MQRVTTGIPAAGLFWFWYASVAGAQAAGAAPAALGPERVVAGAERAAVIAGVLDSLRAAYVFPDSVAAMATALRSHARHRAYDGLTARALAESLTAHLRAARPDGHLRVVYAPESAVSASPPATQAVAGTAEVSESARVVARRANYGVTRVERLEGNVGYLALSEFAEPEDAGPVLAAAMTLLARTDESWTRATVLGPRYGFERPVYVLTSRRTRSAAEAFTYTLQALGRVTVVGDTTAGAAHPGRDRRVGGGFAVFVPDGCPTSPVTRSNWEGTGIAPNVAVPAVQALHAAYVAALRTLAGQARDPERQREVASALDAALASGTGGSASGRAVAPVSPDR